MIRVVVVGGAVADDVADDSPGSTRAVASGRHPTSRCRARAVWSLASEGPERNTTACLLRRKYEVVPAVRLTPRGDSQASLRGNEDSSNPDRAAQSDGKRSADAGPSSVEALERPTRPQADREADAAEAVMGVGALERCRDRRRTLHRLCFGLPAT